MKEKILKAVILEFLLKKGRWGSRHYFPVDTLINWLSKKVHSDRKRLRGAMRELVAEGWLVYYKGREAVFLNPARRTGIAEFLSGQGFGS
jgi:hypothetical protein